MSSVHKPDVVGEQVQIYVTNSTLIHHCDVRYMYNDSELTSSEGWNGWEVQMCSN